MVKENLTAKTCHITAFSARLQETDVEGPYAIVVLGFIFEN